MAELDGKTMGGVVLIGVGGYLVLGAYRKFQIKDYWQTIGRGVVGAAVIYGGIWLFQSKTEAAKEETKEEIKEKITAAIESVNGDED